jgi:hypothetical protein
MKSREYDSFKAMDILRRCGHEFADKRIINRKAENVSNRACGAIDYLIRFHGMVLSSK